MSTDVRHDCDHGTGAKARRFDAALPERLAGLVSEEVWAQSNRRIEEKLLDEASRKTRKRLYIETLANHLVQKVEHAHDATVEDSPEGLPRRAA